ncbi:hypothetical protein MKJ04_04190 [Pontibacter sp. E15-1]|uniref:hypothetical protein n=1 Tax=Pontibacter sp. E15-1 TaxID=2919918 RepID=UPI001F4F91A9|nr:hypothetical protein [Pontibacter sp. E15-1]MCJ8164029.1 hypothetical protein [Pontibacter sp. E15-1]
MFTYTPKSTSPYVRYYYLPANSERQAEVIQVLNCSSEAVQVPMREEDLELTAFFERKLNMRERKSYNSDETWKVYDCWDELQHDHEQFGLDEEVLHILLQRLRYQYPLRESLAASA